MAQQQIDIAFGTSREYCRHMAAGIVSIVERTKSARLRFIILHDGISTERQAQIQRTAPAALFHWVSVEDADVPDYCSRGHFSRPILYRLALDKLAPADCRRVIYLDTDLLLLCDVAELWNMDLAGTSLGAVIDCNLDPEEFATQWGLKWPSVGYLNSGVLLIDLERVRAEGSFREAMEFAAKHAHECQYADQDALNNVFWGRWRALPPRWNAQRYMIVPALAEGLPKNLQFHRRLPAIVHYTGPEKPWNFDGYHPWAWLYWRNIKRTPFFDEVARDGKIGPLRRLRLWLRWLYRKPTKQHAVLRENGDPSSSARVRALL